MNFIYLNLLKTFIAILVVIVVDLAIRIIFIKRVSSKKRQKKYKVLTRNILIISLIVFLAKIWIEGFGHLLAFVGFLSAALTITQKENLLNFAGGLIIMWRDSFTEGDIVSIQGHSGIVNDMGLFYFTLDETKDQSATEKTGKIIKIPNSFISLYPFYVYHLDNFILLDKNYNFKPSTNIELLRSFSEKLQLDVQEQLDVLSKEFSSEEKREKIKLTKKNIFINTNSEVSLNQDKPVGFNLNIRGHCSLKHAKKIGVYIDDQIIMFLKDNDISLAE